MLDGTLRSGSQSARIDSPLDEHKNESSNRVAMRASSAIVALSISLAVTSHGYCSDVAFHAQFNRDHPDIKLTWSNEGGSDPILVKLGYLAGRSLLLSVTTRMYISGPGLSSGDLFDVREPPGVLGRISPFVICLLPGSEYGLTLEAKYLRIPGSSKTLADLRDRRWTLFVSFIGRPAVVVGPKRNDVPYDGVSEYGIQLPLWTGKSKVVIKN